MTPHADPRRKRYEREAFARLRALRHRRAVRARMKAATRKATR